MGCNVKEKSARNARKHRNPKPPHPSADPVTISGNFASSDPLTAPNLNLNLNLPMPNYIPNPNSTSFDHSRSCHGEEKLEGILLDNLDSVYQEALSHLVSVGYDDDLALRAILTNGHCYGSMNVLSNIIHNSMTYLNAGDAADPSAPAAAFSDLRHLEEYSLDGLICLLQQVRPDLSRLEAMWSLIVSELHVGRAATVEIPPHPSMATDCAPLSCKFVDSKRRIPSKMKSCSHSERDSPHDSSTGQSDVVESVMKSLESMSIEEEKPEDANNHTVSSLLQQIQDLETQVKERKEWAQQKAMQAAKKLSNDLTELKVLRMEREENQRVKKGKQALEDTTMKRLSEMESALKKASSQVDRANAVVSRLQNENAEIRAEMEASKLSASESATTCLEVAKREKKCLKRLLVWEKQREKLQEDIVEERRKIEDLQMQTNEVMEAQKEAEAKWREEVNAKEQAITLIGEERRAKEAAEVSTKKKNDALRRKIEIDFQRHKDDMHRLEEELSRLTTNTVGLAPTAQGDRDTTKPAKLTNVKNVRGLKEPQNLRPKINSNRECMICRKDEVNIVFLPCAHQVVCVGCNDDQERKEKAACPCCNAHIDQRIRVFGAAF